jgi:hypothetical protein
LRAVCACRPCVTPDIGDIGDIGDSHQLFPSPIAFGPASRNPTEMERVTVPKSRASNQFVALQSRMLINDSADIMAKACGRNKKRVTG